MVSRPNIRFKGYTDDWEQRKFEDYYKMASGYAFKYQDYCEDGVPLINGESIQHGKIDNSNLNNLPVSFVNEYSDFVLHEKDIVVGLNRPITNGNLKIARIPSDYEGSLLYQRAGRVQYKKAIDMDFSYILLSQEILKFTLREAVGSDQPFISTSKLDKWKIFIPSDKNEQAKIGSFFINLDNLITLHQRKCDETKELKKYMLQKMFPKNGEKRPEIRFEGFYDDWEQRKLNEYLEVSRAKNKDEVFGKEDVLSVSGDYGIVNQIEFQGRSFAGVSVAPYGVVETGDVVYTKSPLKSNPYGIIKTNKGKPGIVSTLYAVYKPLNNVYSEFVQIYFEQDARMNNYMHPLVNKGAKNDMKVSDENALKGEVCFPSKDEQIKISEYFAKLDNLITLHRRIRFLIYRRTIK